MPELQSGNYNTVGFGTRAAMNMPMQGTAADIVKMAMVRVHKCMVERSMKSLMVTQIHDELVFDCPPDQVEVLTKLLKSEMEGVVELSVPLGVDVEVKSTL